MRKPFLPVRGGGDRLEAEIAEWWAKPWRAAATSMFEEWRDTVSPDVCTLCWLRFMTACGDAVRAFDEGASSHVIRLRYLSNGREFHHYERQVTPADFAAK